MIPHSCAVQGANKVVAYFPSGIWYSLTGHPTVVAPERGETLELDVPLGDVAVHVLGGSIVPMQAWRPISSLPEAMPEWTF